MGDIFFILIHQRFLKRSKRKTELHKVKFKEDEIFPGDQALSIIEKEEKLLITSLKWGIKTKSTVINARVETLVERPLFRSILQNRCAVVSNYYYEWNQKKRYSLKFETEDHIYLAGLYNAKGELVILTEESYGPAATIHDRIPVLLDFKEMKDYILLGRLPETHKHHILFQVDEVTL